MKHKITLKDKLIALTKKVTILLAIIGIVAMLYVPIGKPQFTKYVDRPVYIDKELTFLYEVERFKIGRFPLVSGYADDGYICKTNGEYRIEYYSKDGCKGKFVAGYELKLGFDGVTKTFYSENPYFLFAMGQDYWEENKDKAKELSEARSKYEKLFNVFKD